MRKISLVTAILLLFVSMSCSTTPKEKILIAVTKASGSHSYENYVTWLKSFDPKIEIVDFHVISYDSAVKILPKCSGIVLSGGPDIDPKYYGKPEDSSYCDIDIARDTLELKLISMAENLKMPMLAICRGMQILDVAHGGTLYPDIKTFRPGSAVHQQDSGDATNDIILDTDSYLFQITKQINGMVNSNHHQAVDVLAPEFRASAKASDGLVEAFEYANPESMPFMLAVQWHPERLQPHNNPYSFNIGRAFVDHSIAYWKNLHKKYSKN